MLLLALISSVAAASTPDAGWRYVETPLQALINATPNGKTLTLSRGVYGEPVVISNRRDLKIIAPEGAYLLVRTTQKQAVLKIESSSNITVDNLWVARESPAREVNPETNAVEVADSRDVTLRRVYAGAGNWSGLLVSRSRRVLLDDVLVEHVRVGATFDVKSLDPSGGIEVTRSRILAEDVPFYAWFDSPCDWMPMDKPIAGLKVSGSILKGNRGPSFCPQQTGSVRDNLIVRAGHDAPLYQLDLEKRNRVVDRDGTIPGVGEWRPPADLLKRPLVSFAELAPRAEPSLVGRWPLCARVYLTWYLFPKGPRILDPFNMEQQRMGCEHSPEAPTEITDHREGWVQLAPRGVWARLADVSTPCTLNAQKQQLWTRVLAKGPIEAIDEKTVVIVGSADACGKQKLTDRVTVPQSLRPAGRRAFTLECSVQPDRRVCDPPLFEVTPRHCEDDLLGCLPEPTLAPDVPKQR